MNYKELNKEEKQELKERLYADVLYEQENSKCLTQKEKDFILKKCSLVDVRKMPEKIMKKVYDCYDFVKEDFFCNVCNR